MKSDAVKLAQYEYDLHRKGKMVTDVARSDHPLEAIVTFEDGTQTRPSGLIAVKLLEALEKEQA